MKRRKISPDQSFRIKIPCPICNGTLRIQAGDCFSVDKDEWIAEGININCETEPSLDSGLWYNWNKQHYRTPYLDWLPLEISLLSIFQRLFCFDI